MQPQLTLTGDHHQFFEKWQKFANCVDKKKYDKNRLINLYDSSIPAQCSKALASSMPGPDFIPFRLKGYDNLDGNPVPLEGDLVSMAELDWRLLHEQNLALMRERGLIDVDIARVKLNKLVQGSASMADFLTTCRRLFIDVHGFAQEIMAHVATFIDGMNDLHLQHLRKRVPHAVPVHEIAQWKLRAGNFTGVTWEEFEAQIMLDEAHVRTQLRLKLQEPYAAYIEGQVNPEGMSAEVPLTVAAVQAHAPSNTTDSVSGISGVPQSANNPYVTHDDLFTTRRQMEAAYAREHNRLSLQVEKLTETASQTATQVKQVVDTVAALTTVTSQNTMSLDELTSAVQKLTNASAGRDARSQGFKDRKCYNYGQAGHIA